MITEVLNDAAALDTTGQAGQIYHIERVDCARLYPIAQELGSMHFTDLDDAHEVYNKQDTTDVDPTEARRALRKIDAGEEKSSFDQRTPASADLGQ